MSAHEPSCITRPGAPEAAQQVAAAPSPDRDAGRPTRLATIFVATIGLAATGALASYSEFDAAVATTLFAVVGIAVLRMAAMSRRPVSQVDTSITEEYERLVQRTRRDDERFNLIVSACNDGLFEWDLKADCIEYSRRFKEVLGYRDDEFGDKPGDWFDAIHPQDVHTFRGDLNYYTTHAHNEALEAEFRVRHRDGSYRWLRCRAAATRDEHGQAVRLAGAIADITDLKQAHEKLHKDAMHDKLTGLPNRSLMKDRLTLSLARAKRDPKYRFALLFLDFDHFKVINDSLGHSVGDQLLQAIGDRLCGTLRRNDTVALDADRMSARLGGDEFVVMLDGIREITDAELVAERLQVLLSEPYDIDGREVRLTASIGIVTSAGQYDRAEDMLRDADIAMYHAKNAGKARHVVFQDDMHADVVARLNMETDLRRAIEENEFELHYQPILALDTGELTGFEALIRWRHPVQGLVRPDLFIGLAEELGLIVPIGQFALEEAARQIKQWQQRYPSETPLSVNVNLSKRQLAQPDLVDTVRRVIREAGIAPDTFKLEVTESAIMDRQEVFIPRLQELRDLGVKLCMDDFGTGHSSLSSLHRFPIHVLKIDRSFIVNMGERIEFTAVTQAIVTLAHTLNMEVVAEGIETREQLAQLQALECDYAQGYYFAKPMSREEVDAYLDDLYGEQLRINTEAA